MKKIVFYINSISHGGAERVICNLATAFSENGYECILVTSFKSKWEYTYGDKVKRISLFENPICNFLKRNVALVKALRNVLKSECPDVLISFMAEPNFRAIIASMGLKNKVLVSVRNDPQREYANILTKVLAKTLFFKADGIVFQTEDAKCWFPKRLQKKSRIIYNAVKEEFYHIERKPIHGEIVTCGRLEEQKNHIMLIDAFAEVVRKYPFATLKIYGEGSLKEKLQSQINDLGLQKKAFLMGVTYDVGKALQTADLFVLSSDYEGMPNALMEAMAAGVPCISTDCPCGGPRELFGGYGINKLVQCANSTDLASAILRRMENPEDASIEKKLAINFKPDDVNRQWCKYISEISPN